MLTRVKEILVDVSVICTNALETRKKWNGQLTWILKSKDLARTFLTLLLNDSFSLLLHLTLSIFKLLRCYYGKLFCFKKSFIQLIYNFTAYELYIIFIFDLSYIFCLYFLYSFNYEYSLFPMN